MSKDNDSIIPTLDTSPLEETNKGEVYALEDITKAIDEHDDDIMAQKRKALDEGQPVQLKSEFDTLGTLKAISVFRKTAFICAIAGFAASTDGEFVAWIPWLQANTSGYQNQIAANVIANRGFINQFGGMHGGVWKLDPTHVSVFGGIFRSVFRRRPVARADPEVPDKSSVNSLFNGQPNGLVEKVQCGLLLLS
jgi:hypothetical protein